ncbi:MAG: hypothetical protein ACOZDD_02905 [Bacteroidota bacterium]
MKIIKKIFSPILAVVLLVMLLLPIKAEARPFIGSDCETTTTGGGDSCYVTITRCSHYFLWIRYSSDITDLQLDCSHLL